VYSFKEYLLPNEVYVYFIFRIVYLLMAKIELISFLRNSQEEIRKDNRIDLIRKRVDFIYIDLLKTSNIKQKWTFNLLHRFANNLIKTTKRNLKKILSYFIFRVFNEKKN
jgi:hypothetical protein